MIVQHRLIGNIPGRGHGDPLLSPAFPLDSALTTTTAYRAPDPGYIPAQAGRLTDDGKYHVHLTTFEIQATHFGRPVLISANVFRPANTTVRPMIYMNTVAMTQENGAPVSDLSPETLLSFDRFITPAHFASLNAMSTTLSADTWIPVLPPMRKPFFAPGTAAHRSLLGHYWAAASSRIFGGSRPVFSICLGPQTSCEAIIENAKALLLSDILPYLPAAVCGIASMSACVLESSVRTLFKDSALAVIFPTDAADRMQPTFDLRRKDGYPALSELEDRFIASILDGSSTFIAGVMRRYLAQSENSDASKATFAADYDFSLLLYQLERTLIHNEALIPADKLITAWKMLNSLLVSRHRLDDKTVNDLLADVENSLFSHLSGNQAALDAITPADLPALWQKALTVGDALFPAFAGVIAASPAAVSFPDMLKASVGSDNLTRQRIASLVSRICETHYTKQPFDADQLAQLTSAPIIAQVDACPEIRIALGEGLRLSNEVFPDNRLLTLPLTCHLLDGRQALLDAVALLNAQYIHRLPSDQQISNLAAAYSRFADEGLTDKLYEYFAACLPLQTDDMAPLCQMITAILPVTDDIIPLLLHTAQDNGILLQAAQTNALFTHLLPKCTHPAQIGTVYADYERSMTAAAGEPADKRLFRLCGCSGVLQAIHFDAAEAAVEIFNRFAADNALFTPEQADAFFRDLWTICYNKSATYDAFGKYLVTLSKNDPMRFFTSAPSFSGITTFMMHLRNDNAGIVYNILTEAKDANPCAPLEQLEAFFGTFLPYCVSTSAIAHQFVNYVKASIEHAKDSDADLLPWLCGAYDLAKKHQLLTRLQPYELIQIAVRYLCSRSAERNCPVSDDAFSWLTGFIAQAPAAFSEVSGDVRTLYNSLLQNAAGGQTEAQAVSLLRHFAATTDYPGLCELNKLVACNFFRKALTETSYDHAFAAAENEMKRCGMTEEELLARTKTEARAALDRQFSAYKKISDFEKALRSTTVPRDLLHDEVLKEHFVRLKDAHSGNAMSLEQMDRLNSVSSKFGIGTSNLPEIIRRMSEIICQPVYDGSTFAQCMDILRAHQINPSTISKELTGLLKDSMPYLSYPQSIHAAMLCCLSSNMKNVKWKSFFAMLGMPLPEKMPKPSALRERCGWPSSTRFCARLTCLNSIPDAALVSR